MQIKSGSRLQKTFLIGGFILVIVISTILSFIATENGLAFDRDGCFYLGAARIIKAYLGQGPQADLDRTLLYDIIRSYADTARRWPPLYPILLAAVSGPADPYSAARVLHLLFPVILGLLLWSVFYQHQLKLSHAVLATAVTLLSPEILRLNWYAYSEMTFIVWQLLVLIAIGRYLQTGRTGWLITAVFFTALAGLTRYVGIVMGLAVAVTVWRTNRERALYRRILISGLSLLAAILPVMLYLVLPVILSGEFDIAGRSFSWSWTAGRAFIFAGSSLIGFLKYLHPPWGPPAVRIFFAVGAVAVMLLLTVHGGMARRPDAPPPETTALIRDFLEVCLAGYLVLILCWSVLLDPVLGYSGITPRIFAPLFIWLVLWIGFSAPVIPVFSKKIAFYVKKYLISIFILIFILFNLAGTEINAFKNRKLMKNKNVAWQKEETLAYVRNLSRPFRLVSNKPCQLFHYSGVPAFALPSHFNVVKFQPNEAYVQQMTRLREMLHQQNGYVLYFNPLFQYRSLDEVSQETTLDECLRLLDVKPVFYTKNGLILRPPEYIENPD